MIGRNIAPVVPAAVILLTVASVVRIVSQSGKYVVERFGRLRAVLGPGINCILPVIRRSRIASRCPSGSCRLRARTRSPPTTCGRKSAPLSWTRCSPIARIREALANIVDDCGIEATRAAMLQQLNAPAAPYATSAIACAIRDGGVEAAQHQVAMRHVEVPANR